MFAHIHSVNDWSLLVSHIHSVNDWSLVAGILLLCPVGELCTEVCVDDNNLGG